MFGDWSHPDLDFFIKFLEQTRLLLLIRQIFNIRKLKKELWSHQGFFLGALRQFIELFKENSGQFIFLKFSFRINFLFGENFSNSLNRNKNSYIPQTYSGGQRIWDKIETYLKDQQRQPITWKLIQNESVHVPLKFECNILEFEKGRVMILGTLAKHLQVTGSSKEKTWVMQA